MKKRIFYDSYGRRYVGRTVYDRHGGRHIVLDDDAADIARSVGFAGIGILGGYALYKLINFISERRFLSRIESGEITERSFVEMVKGNILSENAGYMDYVEGKKFLDRVRRCKTVRELLQLKELGQELREKLARVQDAFMKAKTRP
jgi:hypothetical protein